MADHNSNPNPPTRPPGGGCPGGRISEVQPQGVYSIKYPSLSEGKKGNVVILQRPVIILVNINYHLLRHHKNDIYLLQYTPFKETDRYILAYADHVYSVQQQTEILGIDKWGWAIQRYTEKAVCLLHNNCFKMLKEETRKLYYTGNNELDREIEKISTKYAKTVSEHEELLNELNMIYTYYRHKTCGGTVYYSDYKIKEAHYGVENPQYKKEYKCQRCGKEMYLVYERRKKWLPLDENEAERARALRIPPSKFVYYNVAIAEKDLDELEIAARVPRGWHTKLAIALARHRKVRQIEENYNPMDPYHWDFTPKLKRQIPDYSLSIALKKLTFNPHRPPSTC